MKYQDEAFAKLEKTMRDSQKIAEKLNNKDNKNTSKKDIVNFPTREQRKKMEEEINKNTASKYVDQIKFDRKKFFGLISMKFPKDYFEHIEETEDYIIYMNIEKEINSIFNYTTGTDFDIKNIKESIQQNIELSKTTWLGEYSDLVNNLTINRLIFITHVPNQDIFNYMVFLPIKNEGCVIINFNGDIKKYTFWDMVIGELIKTIEEV